MKTDITGAVAVVGGGIAGVQASLDLANSGYKVYLIESGPTIGGKMAQLDKTFPTSDCAACILSPKLVEASRHPNIELLTYSEVLAIDGVAGGFTVKVRKKKPGTSTRQNALAAETALKSVLKKSRTGSMKGLLREKLFTSHFRKLFPES
ncbi:FAD-dependent oxidoreductase [Methanosarcina horonobensis]|uniref:FAD-dependent oxidoreductase n=1 Tax=Methanosarcina horonobensis TaxID=418008 RepID=UPI000AF08E16|nr:FAD-dependent oxidoreductase [Methanosarcina horonobensis]